MLAYHSIQFCFMINSFSSHLPRIQVTYCGNECNCFLRRKPSFRQRIGLDILDGNVIESSRPCLGERQEVANQFRHYM